LVDAQAAYLQEPIAAWWCYLGLQSKWLLMSIHVILFMLYSRHRPQRVKILEMLLAIWTLWCLSSDKQ
jgi:hypothetical protein